jgi:hypothetical protein
MKLKEVVSLTGDDSYEDIKINQNIGPRRYERKRRNSRIVEGRETMRCGHLFVGSVLQDEHYRLNIIDVEED